MTLSIAIVDDDETILDAFCLVLEDYGWRVRTYVTGEAFLADLDLHRPDCLILDPHLPGLNGAEVARSMVNSNSHIPIIGLTARPVSDVVAEMTNAGSRVILTKPVTFEVLVAHIKAAVNITGAPDDDISR